MKFVRWFSLLLLLVLVACASPDAPDLPTATLPVLPTTPAPAATPTAQPTATPIPSPTSAPYLLEICSPLEGFSLADLPSLLVNPYDPPQPGMDDGHHGADFAFWTRPDLGLKQMKGLPIHAVLEGTVISVNRDIPPYGYTVIIETPLEQLSPAWQDAWQLPAPIPPLPAVSALTCPELPTPPEWDRNQRALYLLYAHMDQPPAVQAGQSITCGQPIGVVGTSGASVNDHLHLEGRIGPAGASFASLGHYSTAATEEERHNYCVWRVSGWFQLIDPLLLTSSANSPR